MCRYKAKEAKWLTDKQYSSRVNGIKIFTIMHCPSVKLCPHYHKDVLVLVKSQLSSCFLFEQKPID